MRVGINTDIFVEWGGGIDFLRLILKGLNHLKINHQIEVFVFIPIKKTPKIDYLKISIKKSINFLLQRKLFKIHNVKKVNYDEVFKVLKPECDLNFIVFKYSKANFENELVKHKIEIVLPCFNSLGANFKIPWIGYLYDFQHKYYPNFFSQKEIHLRDKLFNLMLSESRVTLVNAQAVKKDAEKYFPKTNSFVIPLPFCPLYNYNIVFSDSVFEKYKLPEKYFLISNQIWQHKDHLTAISGLAMFYEKFGFTDIHLVCTGDLHDYRAPELYEKINEQIERLSLESKVLFLGYIAKQDQLSIMKNAICLIQPSLFEGGPGGGAVYEALAIGVKVVLSDIPVNKEIHRDDCVFFKTSDPNDLAHKLNEVINLPKVTKPEIKLSQDLTNFSTVLWEAINFGLNH